MLSIEIFLATYCLTSSGCRSGASVRPSCGILLAIGTLALLVRSEAEIFGVHYRLFDVGGVVAIASLAVTLIVSVVRNTRALYLAEPLPGRSKNRPPSPGHCVPGPSEASHAVPPPARAATIERISVVQEA